MKSIYKVLLFCVFAPLLVTSCYGNPSGSTKNIIYEDIVTGWKTKADLSSMKYHYGGLTNDLTFCDVKDEFRCIMRDDVLWIGVPRNLDFEKPNSWEIDGFTFTSEPTGNILDCEDQTRTNWIKVKNAIGGDVFVYIINDKAQVKMLGIEVPHDNFNKTVSGNFNKQDVLGYESLFLAIDSCGIKIP